MCREHETNNNFIIVTQLPGTNLARASDRKYMYDEIFILYKLATLDLARKKSR